jgi:hypothetical protein
MYTSTKLMLLFFFLIIFVRGPNRNLSSFRQRYIASELFPSHCGSLIFTVDHLFSLWIMYFRWLCVAGDEFVLLATSLVTFLYRWWHCWQCCWRYFCIAGEVTSDDFVSLAIFARKNFVSLAIIASNTDFYNLYFFHIKY